MKKNATFYARGILKPSEGIEGISEVEISDMLTSIESVYHRKEKVDSQTNKETLNDLYESLKSETLEEEFFTRKTSEVKKDFDNDFLKLFVWNIEKWCKKELNFELFKECPISVIDKFTCQQNNPLAIGMFIYNNNGIHRIEIRDDVLDDPHLLIVTLAHEYLHFIHYMIMNNFSEYNNCPSILAEGFSEFGARLFCNKRGYSLPEKYRKSMNVDYEIGRKIVEQISDIERFELKGFVDGFLNVKHDGSPWKVFDQKFK